MFIARLRLAAACLCLMFAPLLAAQETDVVGTELAVLQAPSDTALADILSGRARLGFNPVVADRVVLRGHDDTAIWLRVRGQAAGEVGPQWLSLERQAMDRVELFLPDRPGRPVAAAGLTMSPADRMRAPDSFLLAIPTDAPEGGALYVRIEGRGFLFVHPQLLTDAQVEKHEAASASLDRWVNLLLGLVAIFGLVRQLRQPDSGAIGLTLAAIVVALASLAANGQLHRVPGTSALVAMGPALVPALWLFACAPLLWSTRRFAGLPKHSPWLGAVLTGFAFAFALAGGIALFLPSNALLGLQVGALAGLALFALVAIGGLTADPRSARFAAMLVLGGLLAALGARALVLAQVLPPTLMARRGFQAMLALLLAVYLVLPWLREIVRDRAKLKRAEVPEPTTEEKIALAREQLMASLQTGLMNASEGDMEWIAYRRMLEGLKPVLPQLASAVVAMNYHQADLLLVEPKDAEPRYRMLLQQRGPMLKNLSRSKAPQQIGLDFDGPEGPLEHVQLAVIPLPIDRPGWGALLIERNATVEYSELELDLAAEFAALATTAGDEAAEALEARQATEFDAESGVYRREVLEKSLRAAHEAALLQRQPLAVLRIGLDDKQASIRALGEVVRDELDFGERVGRWAPDELLVVAPELHSAGARELGERLLAAARKHGLAISIAVAPMMQGERATTPMLERSGNALARVRAAGGNQVQLVTASGSSAA